MDESINLDWELGDGPFPMQTGNWLNFPANFEQFNLHENQADAPNVNVPEPKRKKRFRTIFTPYQLACLEREFRLRQYLDRIRRSQLAKLLNLTEKQIKVWFQNRRMKVKRNIQENSQNVEAKPAEQIAIPTNIPEENGFYNSYPTQSNINGNNFQYFLPPQNAQPPQNIQPTYQPPSCMYANNWNPQFF